MNPRLRSDITFEDLADDECVAMSSDGEVAVVMNIMASVICELCDGNRSIDEIVATICGDLEGAEPQQVRKDVETTIASLSESGLIETE